MYTLYIVPFKLKVLFSDSLLAQVNTQIVITFNPLGSTAQAIPMSPWLYGCMAVWLNGDDVDWRCFPFYAKASKVQSFPIRTDRYTGCQCQPNPQTI